MWALRILSGPQAGQIFPLAPGQHVVGRAPTCEVKINSNSVSKEHVSLLATEDKLIVTDLQSRNGTFVNGVRVQNQRVSIGDKLSLHDILIEVVKIPDGVSMTRPASYNNGVYEAPPPAWAGNAAVRLQQERQQYYQQPQQHSQQPQDYHGEPYADGSPDLSAHASASAGGSQPMAASRSVGGFVEVLKAYIDNVAMPGVYVLIKSMPFRAGLAMMVMIYVVLVTTLSTIPVIQTTTKSIKQESVRRAKSIARNMAAANRQAILQQHDVALSVRSAELEEGVTSALILSAKDGTILAPASMRGEFVNKPFVQSARREEREVEAFIDDSNLGVSVPITVYSAENGTQSVVAYAIVLYDMGANAMNSAATLSLFIQNLSIALLVGALLFFFLYKVVEQPLLALNAQLDDALREGRDDLKTDYQFPMLERLVSNINSALSRIGHEPNAGAMAYVNREQEAANIVRMLVSPAIVVNALDERVIATNPAFDGLVGGGLNLTMRPLTDIPDVALQENLRELIPRMRASIGEIAFSEIPFLGSKYEVNGQAIMGSSEPEYFLIVLNLLEVS